MVCLIANSLYAHGTCECVGDPDTMNTKQHANDTYECVGIAHGTCTCECVGDLCMHMAHDTCECMGDPDTMNPCCIFTPNAYIPNNMHPMYNVPQLATTGHSQPLQTKYFANGGSLAITSMSQVTECMAMIWHAAMTNTGDPHEFKACHVQ